MNDLGMTLAWVAVQVSLVLAPGWVAYALAARRGPAAGASVAALCLMLVVTLTVAAFLPRIGPGRRSEPARHEEMSSATNPAAPAVATIATASDAAGRRWPPAGWRLAWSRLERGAAEPAARCRPWSGAIAALFLAGTAAGLLHLAMGLAAIVACRRRGSLVDDPAMLGLLDELRRAIGCRAAVELREVDDLPGPATAGWRSPVIVLPADWRSWDESDRRAVLAHELAHVVRGDYAAGLIARLAVALNAYHPMVRWLAGQLRLQQELAADVMAASLSESRSRYLVALSRLALRQDGRSPGWPARSFLPARGTLIRRIKMLRDETRIGASDGPWPRMRRLATTAILLGATAAVMTLRGPARGGEDSHNVPRTAKAEAGLSPLPLYLSDHMVGVVALRPAAACRHAAMLRLVPAVLCSETLGINLFERPDDARAGKGTIELRCEEIEQVSFGLGFGKSRANDGTQLHAFRLGGMIAVRMVRPFDWLAFLRQWRFDFAEAREGGRTYYRVTGPFEDLLLREPCVYLPDDRTLVIDQEKVIRRLARGEKMPRPSFLRGPDWERASRGVLAIAIGNQGGAFAKDYDMGRPDDAVVLSMFKGVDHWIFSVDDAEAMVLRAVASCGGDSGAIARTIAALAKQGREVFDRTAAKAAPREARDPGARMSRALLANLRVEHSDRSLALHTDGFGTLADFAAIVEAAVKAQEQGPAPRASKP